MATLTLEGSAEADNGPLTEGELVGKDDSHRDSSGQPRSLTQCCRQCATIVQVYSKHRYIIDS